MASSSRQKRILTLLPMACDGVGPSFTCLQIADGMVGAGQAAEVFAIRRRVPIPAVPMHTALPGPLAFLPFRRVAPLVTRLLERHYVNSLREGDIAFVWPSVSLATHKILHARGVPVVMEGINTRMASAKRILDAAYDAFGMAPVHGITAERIAEEEEKYHHAAAIFAPNRAVETALQGSPLEHAVLPSSYGVDTSKASPLRLYPQEDRPLNFMFCGYACVRKGVHHLLEAWKRFDGPHKLQFVGTIEPTIAERYKDVLTSDRVELVGFVKDVHPWFAKADVFLMPSLEEGGPQVTYEAGAHGLPIIASPMGAGRIGDTPGAMLIADPVNSDTLLAALITMAGAAELRATLGQEARKRAFGFDWADVGARRGRALLDRF